MDCLKLNRALTMDRITGLQDCRIYRINCVGLNWGLKMDRIAGLQDLQDRGLWLSWGLYGQDGRI